MSQLVPTDNGRPMTLDLFLVPSCYSTLRRAEKQTTLFHAIHCSGADRLRDFNRTISCNASHTIKQCASVGSYKIWGSHTNYLVINDIEQINSLLSTACMVCNLDVNCHIWQILQHWLQTKGIKNKKGFGAKPTATFALHCLWRLHHRDTWQYRKPKKKSDVLLIACLINRKMPSPTQTLVIFTW